MKQWMKTSLTACCLMCLAPSVCSPAYAVSKTTLTHKAIPTLSEDTGRPNVDIQVRSEHHEEASESPVLAQQARSAVVMDAVSGKVLFEKDGHEKLPMASITKIMTMLLIMEAIDDGRLKLTDKIKTSEYAASMGGSQIFLQPGEVMTAGDMMKGIAMASANDACVAMAEHLSGSTESFVQKMNAKAKALGMDDTHFVNCNGLPEPDHYSSAHDIALMSRELLKHKEIVSYTSKYSDYLRKDTEHPFWLVNTNKLVRFYDGVDGLKTGFTQEAKYCLSATAQKDGFRVITVVMGEPKPAVRNKEVSQMLNWAFANYTAKTMYTKGQVLSEERISKGKPELCKVVVGEDVGVVQSRTEKAEYETEVKLNIEKLPIKKGDRIGTLVIENHDAVVGEAPLIAGNDVHKAGFFTRFGRTVRKIVTFGAS